MTKKQKLELTWIGKENRPHLEPCIPVREQDKSGNWIINKSYNAAMLAEALCKLDDCTYAPSESVYWQQGYSTELKLAIHQIRGEEP